ncbi:MAG: twin-arginine translocase subunit TatC [Bacteroidetes bacterium]|nr:twin-arginine translocase subunit TatC [Bacteroidota bacterium]MBU2584009.1 twin-arginine translocase subunit TatC [Bacteroidota bacterium]
MEDNNIDQSSGIREMTFLEHLEELRWTLVRAFIGIVLGAILCWVFIDLIIDEILLRPARINNLKLQNLRPFGQLFLYIQVALIGGFIISLPNVVYQIWKFIEPALKRGEKKYVSLIVIFTSLCFLSGVAFAYFLMLPYALNFAGAFGSANITNFFSIEEYFSIIVSVMLLAGIVFELPMLSFFLTKLGILTPKFMRRYRRHSIVVIFILAALLTPTTDPVSQLILAVPLLFLYELSIYISKLSQRKSSD